MQRIISDHYVHTNKMENLEEIDKFLENAQLTTTDSRRNRKSEKSILNKEVDVVFKKEEIAQERKSETI